MADPVWDLVESERLAFADLVEGLSSEELEVQSLCTAWRVRDVAAHVTWGNTHPPLKTVAAVVRGGFRANAVNARLGREWGDRPVDQIVAHLREVAGRRSLTPGTRPIDAMSDVLVHDLDIRVPLGRPRTPPAAAYRLALDRYAAMGWPLSMAFGRNPKATARGLRLVAADIGWEHGVGPEVQASGRDFLLAITGRPVGPDALRGQGAAVLRARLDGSATGSGTSG